MLLLALIMLGAPRVGAQDRLDEGVIARITMEAFQRSTLMDTVSRLADRYGPRLGGSLEFAEAARWTRVRLSEWGLDKRVSSRSSRRVLAGRSSASRPR